MRRNSHATMKAIVVLVIIIILATVAFVYLAPKKSDTVGKPVENVLSDNKPVQLAVTKKIITSDGTNPSEYTATVEYPVLSGLPTTDVLATAINVHIYDTAMKFIDDFKQNIGEPIPDLADAKNTLAVNYSEPSITHNIVSFVFDVSEYEIGAAHPNSYEETENYSLITGDKVSLQDLFKDNTEYLAVLSQETIKQLDTQFTQQGIITWFKEGAAPQEENYKQFILTNNALEIIFNPSQVAPYVVGTVSVDVPLAILQSMLK